MTLGGLALAVGILVDDATVTIENIERYLEEGQDLRDGHPRRRGADRGARARLHALHLHRVPADVLPGRASRATCSCRWPRRWSSPCSRPTCCRARWCRRWPCTCCGRARIMPAPHPESVRAPAAGVRARLRAAARPATATCSRRLVSPPGRSSCRSSWRPACRCVAAAAVARPGLLPDQRQRPVHPAPARQDRHAHRGDGAARRPGRGGDPAARSPRTRSTTSSTTSACRTAAINLHYSTLRHHRRRGRRHPGHAQAGASAHRGLRARRCGHRLPQRVSRASTFYFLPADIVTQILNFGLPAPDRRADRGHRPRGQPRRSPNKILRRAAAGAGRRRPAHPAALRLPELRGRRRPHQGGGQPASPSATSPAAC